MIPILRLVPVLLVGAMLAPSLVQARQPAPRDTLRLDAAVQRALDDNRQARIARRETDIAENNVSLGNAGFLPTLSGQANYSKTRSNSEQVFLSGETQSTDGATSTQSGAGADLRWTVFDGLRPFATYDRLGAERDRQAAATDEQVETLVADVIEGYYDVARQQQQLEVLREAVAISRERLRIAELRRELGSASDLEVRQARVDLNADSTEALRQAAALTNAKNQLNRLLARPEDASTRYAVASAIEVDTSLQYASTQQTALQESPALTQAREALRAAQAEQRELRADFFPTVDLTAGLNYSQLNAESGFVQENTSTEVTYGVSLSLDLFDGLNRWRRTQNADIRTTNARLAVEDVRARLVTELTNAYERYRNRLRLVDLERQTLKAVRANVDVALEQFEQGTITSVELREVQEQFVQAESRLLTVQFEAKQAEVELLRLSGQLLDQY
ncbi:outer membrane protein TolC [Salinibacter ruber]|uniref:TolC family protein n=1 Tax=Salinibacter ruber TaxID=146919 RepID=UPI002169A15C|nr:TolC family protein [Salinibacter ruber]MCS3631518.1 outer membrane protein TolC [Salinibacter ruber]